jgi:membrane associated rhomboid family serine protease
MWLVKAFEYFSKIDLIFLGIFPRDVNSLSGIFTSPFIHGDFNHLISNTMPIFFLSLAIQYFYRKLAYRIIFLTWIFVGLSVWLGGRYSWHIGASGLVYAFASFLFFSGILSKDRKLIAVSLLIIFLYGGLIWGILPTNTNISWESHLYGFVIGFILAFFLGKEYLTSTIKSNIPEIEDFSERNYTFEKDYEINYWYGEEMIE